MKTGKRIRLLILLFPLFLVLTFSIYQLYISLTEAAQKQAEYEIAHDEYLEVSKKAVIENTENDLSENSIDFDYLLSLNDDVVGYIVIEGTNISYPILQGENNNQYLRHTIMGTYNSSGCIFLDCNNSPDFSDKNSIVYGHNMKNGSMFAQLNSFKKQSFADEHREIQIYTPTNKYVGYILSVYVVKGTSDTYTISFPDDNTFFTYIQEVKEKSLICTDTSVTAEDRILTLSTCSDYSGSNLRLIVQALLKQEA